MNPGGAANLRAVTPPQLLGIFSCLALALAAHVGTLPVWVFGVVAAAGAVRMLLARRGRPPPPRGVRLVITALAISLLFLQFRTFNGLAAGSALLALAAGLKLLETETQRDIHVITLIIYFVGMAALLEGNSFWLLAYLIAVCWVTAATLLRLTTTLPAPGWPRSLLYSGRILGQALPLALVLWLLFPRFAGPLWHIPEDRHGAASGLSDTMSPGDFDKLALSDEVAFRVRFTGAAPPAQELYWRGPVLHDFDGRTWRPSASASFLPPPLEPKGPAYGYTVSLEPSEHNWLFALDWPSHWDSPGAVLTADYTLMRREPVAHELDVRAVSYTRVQSSEPLSDPLRRRDTRLPPGRNPRSMQLAGNLRRAHRDDMDYVRAVLSMFAQEPFFYTLTPPKLAANSVDEFLFDTRRGFCEHYASAFAALMRAAGIPSRVITGYQGGTFNRFADYWIVRQSDAHAWNEVWIDGRGWVRIDPTSAVDPARVEHGLGEALGADEPLVSRWQRRSPWLADMRLRLDALRQVWRERILFFDQNSQQQLLEWLDIPAPDGRKMVLLLTAALGVVFCWLTWQVRREAGPARREPLMRVYARLCAKLAAAGIERLPHEGAEDFAARVARRRPDLAAAVTALCSHYSSLRYAPHPAQGAIGRFRSAVREFRAPHRAPAAPPMPAAAAKPRDSRGS